MTSLLTKYNKYVYDDRSINKAKELIEKIEPLMLKEYLNNYYLLGVTLYNVNDTKSESLKNKIKEYINNNVENVEILNDLETRMKEHLQLLMKIKENKPNLTADLDTKLKYFILGLQRLKDKKVDYLGGGKYKMHSKKEILGKMRCIYKKEGDRKDRKEYIKHKGNFITLRKFREYNKQKK